MDINKSSLVIRAFYLVILLVFLIFTQQNVKAASHGGLQLNVEITFGTHNAKSRVGLLAFGTTSESNFAAEIGAGVWAQTHLKRFGATTSGWSIGYDAFSLVGIGDNSNLLGSAITESIATPIYRDFSEKSFFGFGVGIVDENFSGSLNKFSLRRGKIILRAANKTSSLHITFANDLRESLLHGGATDYGQTAALALQYNQIRNNSLTQLGFGLDFFTPQPDYNFSPNNPLNSDEGRKRVWHTSKPWDKLFNANLFFEFARQDEDGAISVKLGVDSPKLGAFAQNTIHDSFGLLPRYPWPVNQEDKVFFETTVSKRVK